MPTIHDDNKYLNILKHFMLYVIYGYTHTFLCKQKQMSIERGDTSIVNASDYKIYTMFIIFHNKIMPF